MSLLQKCAPPTTFPIFPPTLPIESMIGDVNLFFSGEMEGGELFMSTGQANVAEIDIMIAGMRTFHMLGPLVSAFARWPEAN